MADSGPISSAFRGPLGGVLGRRPAVQRGLLGTWDRAVFQRVASHHWPGADRVLPRLSRGADHGALWFAAGAAMTAVGGRSGRKAAVRGAVSLAFASTAVNTLGKRAVRRVRPVIDAVPVIRRLRRQPFTTSFPSGHAASAAAFALGVGLESRRWGAVIAPIAASVAFSRVYTGVHYPSDVIAGAALGMGAALAVRGLAPTRAQLPPPGTARTGVPALPDGRGLVVVANAASGPQGAPLPWADPLRVVRETLPEAEFVHFDPQATGTDAGPEKPGEFGESGPPTGSHDADLPGREDTPGLAEVLEQAARRARERGGALGICGGDGTVGAAAAVAARHGLPLAVLPGGTRNHFAYDLGIGSAADTCRALASGHAVAVDLARFTPGTDGEEPSHFLNTFSVGSYPDLVRVRERWAPRIGGWPAGLVAAAHVLRTAEPLDIEVNGRRRSVWLLFVGNCSYRGFGPAPSRQHDLADGLLDVRIVHGGRWARSRLLAAAFTGALRRSPVYGEARVHRLRIGGLAEGTRLAYDGEVAPAPRELTLDKAHEGLSVYRPLDLGASALDNGPLLARGSRHPH